MRRLRSVLICLIAALLLTHTITLRAQQSKTLVVRPKTGEFAGRTLYTNSHALIVGISQYQFLPKEKWLDFAAQDALDIRDVLIRSYGFPPENVTLLLNEQGTKKNIEDTLAGLADESRVKSDDRVLVFFSGHGQTVKLQNGGEMGFLIPYDAKVDLAHPDNRGPYLATCLPMDHVWSYLEGSPAKHSLLIADACFGGLLVRGRALNGERPNPAVVATLAARPAQQVLTAGGKNEEAQEDPKLGHGYLTFKLLEELKAQAANPDTVFLASQLAGSLKTSVANLTGAKQNPQFGNHNETEGDFVFVSTEPRQVPDLPHAEQQPHPELPGNPGPVITPYPALKLSGIANGHMYRTGKPDNPVAGDVCINPKDGAEMAFIPGGEFTMGDKDFSDAPPHTVRLTKGYWMYRYDVTVAQYEKFCQETGRQMQPAPDFNPDWKNKDHPIVNVSWNDAMAYCQWAGVTLPTEAQWERAAKGPQGFKFPWGNTFDSSMLWCSKSNFGDAGGTSAVGKFSANGYGLYDMAGNVFQLCLDCYNEKFYSSRLAEQPDPVNTVGNDQTPRALRGGSWVVTKPDYFRASKRKWDAPVYWNSNNGFRCASQD